MWLKNGEEIMSLLGLPRTTAIRKLGQLIEMGRLKKIGIGRSTRYVIRK